MRKQQAVMVNGQFAAEWVLSLELIAPDCLRVALSDTRWQHHVALAPWPPVDDMALPATMVQALTRVGAAHLRMQLPVALDPWCWEREIAGAHGGCVVSRYLIDWPTLLHDEPGLVPLVVGYDGEGESHLSFAWAAYRFKRPLVVTDAALSAAQRLALANGLRNRWRDPLLLSQALALVLKELDWLPQRCRLYGDGWADPSDTEQGWRPVTVLSIDLVNSTGLLQTLGAEHYAQRLQAYHKCCQDVIVKLQGSLDVPQGDDGLMAYFGFPHAVENTAARALTAAWQLSRGMVALGLQVRIGVASGPVAVSAQQAFGGDVILAARLREAAKPGQVLVAPATRDRAGNGFVFELLTDPPEVKNFPQVDAVHQLVGLVEAPVGIAARQSSSQFVGRRHELEHLRAAWAVACGGRLQWCVIGGEAGMGKSRLLYEFSSELQAQGERCLALRGHPLSAQSPFAGVVDGLRQYWAIGPQADTENQDQDQDLGSSAPALITTDSMPDDLMQLRVLVRDGQTPTDAKGQRRWSDSLLAGLLAVIGSDRLCLFVDDAQWLDPSTTELLRRLRQAASAKALLLVMAERTELGRSSAPLDVAPLELTGLAPDEAQAFIEATGAKVPEQLRRRILARAEGVPLYLEECLRMFSQQGSAQGADVPATLEDLLMVRLDGLGPDRALAQLIAVLGRECHDAQLQGLLAKNDPFVQRVKSTGSLNFLLDSGLLQIAEQSPLQYRFKHALIRDAAYASISSTDRQRLHSLCADVLACETLGLWRQHPEHLAHHLQAAGRLAAARGAWLTAAQLAASRSAHQETVELALRALPLMREAADQTPYADNAMQLHLLIASAKIALQGYGSAEVEAAYLSAERYSSERTGQANADTRQTQRIRLGLEACYVMRGDLIRAHELATSAVATNHWKDDPRLAMQSRWAQANVRFHQGHWSAALAGFDDCLARYDRTLHRSSSVQDPAVMCLGYSSWVHFELGLADEALRRIDRMLTLTQTLQHPFSTGIALGFAASVKRLCGDTEGAWPHALEAVQVCERGGFLVWLAHAWMVRGQLRADRGDRTGGDEDMDRGYHLWVDSGARISCATYLATRAEIWLRQGRTSQARAALETAWQESQDIGEHYYLAELQRLQGLCAWQNGELTSAQEALHQAWETATQQHKPGLMLRCALSLGALNVAHGDAASAVSRLRPLLDALPDHSRCRDWRWANLALAHWSFGTPLPTHLLTPWEPL